MKSVAETHHLLKRGGVWHYYRRVPKPIVKTIGRRFIKRSFGVTSLVEAKKLRCIEDLKTDAMFAAAEKQGPSLSAPDGQFDSKSISSRPHRARAGSGRQTRSPF